MRELKYSEILKANNQLKKLVEDIRPYSIGVLNNITCNQFGATLSYHLMKQGINPIIQFGNYDNILQDSFNQQDKQLVIVHYELLNIIGKADCYVEDMTDEQLDDIASAIESELSMILHNLTAVPCVLFNTFSAKTIEISPLRNNKFMELADRLNHFVTENKPVNTYVVNIENAISKIGVERTYDMKLYNLSKTLYSIDFWKEYTLLISPIILKVTGKSKKAVIFDCDNTLWKGILGEDGFNGIDMSPQSKLGSFYHTIQNMAVWLSKHGVLIGLCSKNNPEDVAEVVAKHKDMALRDENIVISEVNWNDKASNLQAIAENLNIGLDSIVFVDDSDFEINLIKEQLPQVLCLQVPDAIYNFPIQFADIINTYFFFSDNKSDLDKTLQYKQQACRNQQKSKFTDITDYLKSLEMVVSYAVDRNEDVERVSQLTQKTNQLNVCTNRYTQSQIDAVRNSSRQSYIALSVSDKFGDSGLTGVAIVSYENNMGRIDDFLMSCRVMGRNIEFAFVDYVVDYLKQHGCDTIEACYLPTQKNKPVSEFYDRCGFSVVSNHDGTKKYVLHTEEYNHQNISYIKIK